MNAKKAKRLRKMSQALGRGEDHLLGIGHTRYVTYVNSETGEETTFQVPSLQAINDPKTPRGVYRALKKYRKAGY